jgi:hypothetical protein
LLKSSYLALPDRLRIDEVVQILTDEVEAHYRWSQQQVETGFAGQTSNKFQMQQKITADAFTSEDMEMLGVTCAPVSGGVSCHSRLL